MFPKLGMGELIVILLIVVVLFGASKLPQLGKGLGEGIRSFKKSFSGEDEEKPTSTPGSTRSDEAGPKAYASGPQGRREPRRACASHHAPCPESSPVAAITFEIGSSFAAEDAVRLHDALALAAPDMPVEIDFHRVREWEASALAVLARDLAERGPLLALRGLSQPQLRVLGYLRASAGGGSQPARASS